MIYHGSTVQNLKIIEPNESTQKGAYVYGAPNIVTAAIFAVAQKTGKPFPPLCRLRPGYQSMAERFENQFASLENMPISIYILDEQNFKSFKEDPSGHSSGDEIELRAEESQKVKNEIKIDNVLKFLKDNGVTLYEYKDREKVGIPKSDKYFIKGILTTYLWKIEGRKEEDFLRGEEFLNEMKECFSKYNELLDDCVSMIKKIPQEVAINFANSIYDYKTDDFNPNAIKEVEQYLKQNSNLLVQEKRFTR